MFITTCHVEAISASFSQFTESKGDFLSPSAPTATPCSTLIPSRKTRAPFAVCLGWVSLCSGFFPRASFQTAVPFVWVEDPLGNPTLGHAHFHGQEPSLFIDKPSR